MIQIKNRYSGEVICEGENVVSAAVANRADLRCAYLLRADLRRADLRCADFSGADLLGAKMAWQSHDLIAEILCRAAGDDIDKLKVAGLILIWRKKCWSDFLSLGHPLADWAMEELRKWIVDGDDHPHELEVKEQP